MIPRGNLLEAWVVYVCGVGEGITISSKVLKALKTSVANFYCARGLHLYYINLLRILVVIHMWVRH